MNIKKIIAAIRKALRSTPMPVPPPTPPPPPAPGDFSAELLAAHNARRTEVGLPALGASVKLQAAAIAHADRMASVGKMAHVGIGDGDLASRLLGVGYRFRGAGENVAWGQRDVAAVMSSWMNSPGHRANILGNFAEAGLAVARGADGSAYWCAVFGSPSIQARVPAVQSPYSVGTPEVAGDGTTSSITIAAD